MPNSTYRNHPLRGAFAIVLILGSCLAVPLVAAAYNSKPMVIPIDGDPTPTAALAPRFSGIPFQSSAIASSAFTGCSSVNLQVTAQPENPDWPASVPDGAGGAIVVWQEAKNFDTSGWDLYAKHILACGGVDPSWVSGGIGVTTAPGDQIRPIAVPDGVGGVYVAWESGSDIYAQHLLGSGAIHSSWPTNGLPVCTAPGSQLLARIAADGTGGAYVTWDDRRDGVNHRHAFVHHLLPSGLDPAWATNGVRVCPSHSESQFFPEVCTDGAGGVIVVWGDDRNSGGSPSERDIYAQHMTSTGTPLWNPDGVPVTTAPTNQIMNGANNLNSVYVASYTQEQAAPVVPDGQGGCFVVWRDLRNGNGDVYAQHVTSSGSVASGWGADGVALCTDVGQQSGPTVVSDGSGGAIAAWLDDRFLPFVQHVNASGVVDGPTNGLALSPQVGGGGTHAALISDGLHGAIAAWGEGAGGDYDQFAQHLVTSGGFGIDPSWPVTGAAVSTAPGFHFFELSTWLCRDGAGGAIFTFLDTRNSDGSTVDLYSQRVLADGTLPQLSLTGHVTSSCGSGLQGVAADAYLVGSGDLVGTGVTNASGVYSIPGLCWGGNYTVTVVTPLDYAATAQDLPASSCASSADFPLACLTATGTPNSMGYWKHQVGVLTGGNGHADVTAATMCGYLDLIAAHFNNNLINQVIVYQPPASGQCSDKLKVAKTLLDLQGSATMIARARQMLLSLLLNVASNAISQTLVISADGATVSQAITYCDNLIDSPTGNYEKAKTIADDINNGMTVPAGMIPLSTAQIAYRKGMEAVSFRVMPGTSGATRGFQFMTGARGPVSLRIFDVSGRLVAQLYRGNMNAGPHSVSWNGRTSSGDAIAKGLYFARLETPRESPTIKVLELTAPN